MKTRAIKASEIVSKWVVLDASGQTLGRLATQAATLLMGKHKAMYTPYLDTGDHVVIVNAEKVQVTGKKLEQKVYFRHSGYPGGLRSVALGTLMKSKPEWVVEHAVRGMLPKTKLGDAMMRKLRVHVGATHPYQGQINPGSSAGKSKERPAKVSTITAEEAEPQAT